MWRRFTCGFQSDLFFAFTVAEKQLGYDSGPASWPGWGIGGSRGCRGWRARA